MFRFLTTALLLTTAISPAFAENIDFQSKVTEVTVYPTGAQIIRVATGQIKAGDHVVVIEGLPAELFKNSVRVTGQGDADIEIGSVDVRQTYVAGKDNSTERKQLERQIEDISDQVSEIDQTWNNAKTRRNILLSMTGSPGAPKMGEETKGAITASQLREILEVSSTQLKQISSEIEQARKSKRKLNRQLTELKKKLTELVPKKVSVSVVSINLKAAADTSATFAIRYTVSAAGWTPVYDAKLKLGAKGKDSKITLVRRATVHQQTGDVWEGVKLTLSTARPSANTQVPTLRPWIISKVLPRPKRRMSYEKRVPTMAPRPLGAVVESDDFAASPKVKKLARRRKIRRTNARIVFSGFLAEYKIAGPVNISATGEDKNVIIGSSEYSADLIAKTVPQKDRAAYLTANFTIKGKSPLLPGAVLLSRDGVFLGRARMPELKPGQKHTLSFGKDDFIKVTRTKTVQKARETGFVSKSNVAERKIITTVENLHDFPMKIMLLDRLPYSTHEDIVVEMMQDITKPDQLNVKKQRGIVAWNLNLKAKAKTNITFGYRVTWPKDMRITGFR